MPTLVTLVDGTIPVAADFNGNYQALNNAIGASTAITGYTTGDTLYASATDTLSKLPAGSVGKVLTMGASVPGWQGGAWITPAYSAGDFTGGGSQTWTVDSGDVTTYAYLVIGKTMWISFRIENSSVGGTPDNRLNIKIPGGFTAAKTGNGIIRTIDNGTQDVGMAEFTAAGTLITCYRNALVPNWSASTDATHVMGQLVIEVQ